jgi:hypothetical protein
VPLFGQYGAFDELHNYQDGSAFADAIVKQANQSYGTAGREYFKPTHSRPRYLVECLTTAT